MVMKVASVISSSALKVTVNVFYCKYREGFGFVSGKRSIDTLKMECLKKEFIESDINIVGLMEVNKD